MHQVGNYLEVTYLTGKTLGRKFLVRKDLRNCPVVITSGEMRPRMKVPDENRLWEKIEWEIIVIKQPGKKTVCKIFGGEGGHILRRP